MKDDSMVSPRHPFRTLRTPQRRFPSLQSVAAPSFVRHASTSDFSPFSSSGVSRPRSRNAMCAMDPSAPAHSIQLPTTPPTSTRSAEYQTRQKPNIPTPTQNHRALQRSAPRIRRSGTAQFWHLPRIFRNAIEGTVRPRLPLGDLCTQVSRQARIPRHWGCACWVSQDLAGKVMELKAQPDVRKASIPQGTMGHSRDRIRARAAAPTMRHIEQR